MIGNDPEVDALKDRVERLEELTETLLKVVWMQRGLLKDLSNKAEKDLGQFWDEYLKSHNKNQKMVYNAEKVTSIV